MSLVSVHMRRRLVDAAGEKKGLGLDRRVACWFSATTSRSEEESFLFIDVQGQSTCRWPQAGGGPSSADLFPAQLKLSSSSSTPAPPPAPAPAPAPTLLSASPHRMTLGPPWQRNHAACVLLCLPCPPEPGVLRAIRAVPPGKIPFLPATGYCTVVSLCLSLTLFQSTAKLWKWPERASADEQIKIIVIRVGVCLRSRTVLLLVAEMGSEHPQLQVSAVLGVSLLTHSRPVRAAASSLTPPVHAAAPSGAESGHTGSPVGISIYRRRAPAQPSSCSATQHGSPGKQTETRRSSGRSLSVTRAALLPATATKASVTQTGASGAALRPVLLQVAAELAQGVTADLRCDPQEAPGCFFSFQLL